MIENLEGEIWMPIKDFEGLYEISNMGRVKSCPTGCNCKNRERLLKARYDGYYLSVNLCKNGKAKSYRIHRLVAMMFLPNPHSFTDVNHIDEDKLNNRLINLEWVTHKQNQYHSNIPKKILYPFNEHRKKKVAMYSSKGTLLRVFDSIHYAARCTNNTAGNVSNSCTKNKGALKGLIFRFYNQKKEK